MNLVVLTILKIMVFNVSTNLYLKIIVTRDRIAPKGFSYGTSNTIAHSYTVNNIYNT